MPSLSRLETSKKDENMFPLSRDNYEKLRERLGLYKAFTLSEQHFEVIGIGSWSLRLPKVNTTWSNISVECCQDCLIVTTGLTREKFKQIHETWGQLLGGGSLAAIFIISLLLHLKEEVSNDLIENQRILKTVEKRLVISTRPSQDQEIKQEVSLGSLNKSLIDLIVSTSEVQSRLEYISGQFEYIGNCGIHAKLNKLNTATPERFEDMVQISQKSCQDRMLDVEFLEKRINTNITVVRHPSPNILSLELSTALTT